MVRLTSGVVPNQLPAAIVCTGVFVVPNAVAFLEGRGPRRLARFCLLCSINLVARILSFLDEGREPTVLGRYQNSDIESE